MRCFFDRECGHDELRLRRGLCLTLTKTKETWSGGDAVARDGRCVSRFVLRRIERAAMESGVEGGLVYRGRGMGCVFV